MDAVGHGPGGSGGLRITVPTAAGTPRTAAGATSAQRMRRSLVGELCRAGAKEAYAYSVAQRSLRTDAAKARALLGVCRNGAWGAAAGVTAVENRPAGATKSVDVPHRKGTKAKRLSRRCTNCGPRALHRSCFSGAPAIARQSPVAASAHVGRARRTCGGTAALWWHLGRTRRLGGGGFGWAEAAWCGRGRLTWRGPVSSTGPGWLNRGCSARQKPAGSAEAACHGKARWVGRGWLARQAGWHGGACLPR